MNFIIIVVSLILFGCSIEEPSYTQYVPQQNIFNWAWKPVLHTDSIKALFSRCVKGEEDEEKCLNVYFRANKGQFNSKLFEMAKDTNEFRAGLAIYSAGKTCLKLPSSLANHSSAVIRQYYMNYLRLGCVEDAKSILLGSKSKESNRYVLKTIDFSLLELDKSISSWKFDHHVFDSLNEPFSFQIYNDNPDINSGMWFMQRDSTNSLVYSDSIIKPTIAFDYNLPNTPGKPNFMYTTDNEYFHVGEDISWDWQGLPAHAIADSRVKYISYDSSWGIFVVFETVFRNKPFTYYYGHLKNELYIKVGDVVKAGQVIGFIGEATSIENGGYRAHIHLGIEESFYKNAEIGGYEFSQKSWIAPREFLEKYSR